MRRRSCCARKSDDDVSFLELHSGTPEVAAGTPWYAVDMEPDEAPGSAKDFRPRRHVGALVVGVLLALVAVFVGSLFMPVCVRIPDEQVPAFEQVRPLSERAASGEPFEKKGKHWYQCKSRLARMFFF